MTALSARKEQMSKRLAELEAHLREIEAALEQTPNRDAEERATEREGDQVLEGLGVAEVQEAQMIRAALMRMDDGEYGFCARCGEDISPARLDLLPFAPLCARCAK